MEISASHSLELQQRKLRIVRSLTIPRLLTGILSDAVAAQPDSMTKYGYPSAHSVTMIDTGMQRLPVDLEREQWTRMRDSVLETAPQAAEEIKVPVRGLELFGHMAKPHIALTFADERLDEERTAIIQGSKAVEPAFARYTTESTLHMSIVKTPSQEAARVVLEAIEPYVPEEIELRRVAFNFMPIHNLRRT